MNNHILTQQLTACLDQSIWFVCLQDALDGLTAEQAAWKTDGTNSIWEIVNHLIYYNRRHYDRFQGKTVEDSSTNINTFASNKELSWEETAQYCQMILANWREAIGNTDEEELNDSFYDWNSILSQLTIHNAYHIGQIVHIRKQQRSWNEERGVKG
jgi:hypothetical protein